MDNPKSVEISVQLSVRDVTRLHRNHYIRKFWYFSFLPIVLFANVGLQAYSNAYRGTAFELNVIPPMAASFGVAALLVWAPYASARNLFKFNKDLSGTILYAISESGLQVNGVASRTHLDWSAISQFKESREYAMFILPSGQFHAIPKRCIPADYMLEQLKSLANSKLQGRAS